MQSISKVQCDICTGYEVKYQILNYEEERGSNVNVSKKEIANTNN